MLFEMLSGILADLQHLENQKYSTNVSIIHEAHVDVSAFQEAQNALDAYIQGILCPCSSAERSMKQL